MKNKKNIPFDFVLDYLLPLDPAIKPMFGCYAIYVGEKIMLVLRNRKDHQDANGIWIATSKEHHVSLKKDFPSLHSILIIHPIVIDECRPPSPDPPRRDTTRAGSASYKFRNRDHPPRRG